MTCIDRPKHKTVPAHMRQRVNKECCWVRDNAHRLWPNTFAVLKKDGREPRFGFRRGLILVNSEIAVRYRCVTVSNDYMLDGVSLTTGYRIWSKVLRRCPLILIAERGITHVIGMSYCLASRIAPVLALDEPFAMLKCVSDLQWYHHNSGYLRSMERHGLREVYDMIPHEKHRQTMDRELASIVVLNHHLTLWARRKAQEGNPPRHDGSTLNNESEVRYEDGSVPHAR